MDDSRSALTERIAFAEEWLDRAKRQLADGNVAHGSLHLMLAEAELQRAREVTGGSKSVVALPPRSAVWTVKATAAIAGAIAVAGVIAALVWHVPVLHYSVDAADSSWPVVMFSEQTGDMLRIVSARGVPPEPVIVERTVERTIVKPMIVRVTMAPPVRSAPVVESASVAPIVAALPATRAPNSRPVASTQPENASAVQPAAVEAPRGAPVISDADVIDLVLAAERSLRQPAKH
jgi:hypothetical protein